MVKLKVTEIITYISTLAVINIEFFKISLCLPCNRRDTPNENFVCVCDATYCDSADPIPKLNSSQYAVYSTSKSGKRMELTVENFVPTTTDSQADIVIDRSTQYQKIMSFGGAMTDATAITIASLPKPAQDLLMQSYFGENGNNYNLIRVPIAGTDFSTRPYTYDDTTPNDTDLSHFQLQEEDTKYKIPYIQQAMQLSSNKIILMGCPWTAPPWMKTNNAHRGSGSLREEYFQLWADYYIKFLQAYGSNGLNFTILSAQNEPMLSSTPYYFFNGMGWNASGQANWIANYFGPTLKKNGYENIQILIGDDQRGLMPYWVKTVSQNVEAIKYVSGVGIHWYLDNLSPTEMLDNIHNTKGFDNKWILYSEACEGSTPFSKGVVLGSWNRAETYFQSIIDNLGNWVVGWTDWNMALNMDGGPTYAGNNVDSPIIVDATKEEFYKQPMYYAIGHASKFLPTDSVRLGLQNNNTFVFVVAFQTPNNNTVILLLNTHEVNVPIKILDKAANKMLQFTMENRSIKTIIY